MSDPASTTSALATTVAPATRPEALTEDDWEIIPENLRTRAALVSHGRSRAAAWLRDIRATRDREVAAIPPPPSIAEYESGDSLGAESLAAVDFLMGEGSVHHAIDMKRADVESELRGYDQEWENIMSHVELLRAEAQRNNDKLERLKTEGELKQQLIRADQRYEAEHALAKRNMWIAVVAAICTAIGLIIALVK